MKYIKNIKLGSLLVEDEHRYNIKNISKDIPTIDFNLNNNKYYTLILVDPDAPSREVNFNKHYLHWLIVNINNQDKLNYNNLIDYLPPSPPILSGYHRYYFYLFEQKEKYNNPDNLRNKYNINNDARIKFDPKNFEKNNLVLVDRMMIHVINN
jgi:phosphatidylethanolamine-binding protein (PEBP) family uncharacterized protein